MLDKIKNLFKPPVDNRKNPHQPTTEEIYKMLLQHVERSGTGHCKSYDLKSEIEHVRNHTSGLSARQRMMVLKLAKDYRL